MIVIQDTREQTPFRFSDDVQVERAALPVGDYSIKGLEDVVTVERKSLPDLLTCIGRDRERFIRELRQLRAFRFAALVVESNWPTIMTGMYGISQVRPNAVIGSLMSFTVKYGVVPILADDHATASMLVERLLGTFARMVERDCAALHRAPVESTAGARAESSAMILASRDGAS